MTQAQWIALGWQLAGWLAVPLSALATRWVWSEIQLASTDKKSAVLRLVGQVATVAVTAAEQTIAANPDKKAAALKFVSDYLAQHNINVPLAQIDAAIESAVATETDHATPKPAA